MIRRNFLRNIFLSILAFIFGYNVKNEEGNIIIQRFSKGDGLEDNEIKILSKKLKENILDLESRGVNALNPPAPFTPVQTDGTDASTTINLLLKNFEVVYLPPKKTYSILNTLVIPTGKVLFSDSGMASIKLLKPNIPGIELHHLAKVDNLSVILASGNTSKDACGFRLLADYKTARQHIGKVEVIGSDRTGNGVYMADSSGNIAFSIIDNIYCSGVNVAVFAEMTKSAYANGVIINNIVIRSSIRGFWLVGANGMVANNIEWNTSEASIEVIYCNSYGNQFSGFFYDLSEKRTNVLATFDKNATNNFIRSAPYNSWEIVDYSNEKHNYLNNVKTDSMDIICKSSYLPHAFLTKTDINKWGSWYRYKPFGGHQDNVFAFADKINIVKNVGKPISDGKLSSIFDPFQPLSESKPQWILETGEKVIIDISILVPNNSNKRLDFVEVVFSPSLEASFVKIEAFNENSWTTLKEVSNNDKRFVVFHDDITAVSASSNPTKIRLTVSNPINFNKIIKIESFLGRMLSSAGFTFLPRNGGKLYGNLNMIDNFLTVGKVNTLPAANFTRRGQIIRIEGAKGVEDKVYICKKKADETYDWVQIDM